MIFGYVFFVVVDKIQNPDFWIQKRILRFLHGSRIHKTHTPNVFSMQQWYTIVTVHDRQLAPSSSPWGSRKMVGLCANFTQKKLTKKYYSASELTFLQLNNLGTKNTLASYLLVNKQACFYQLFLSIAAILLFPLRGPLVLLLVEHVHMIHWWLVLSYFAFSWQMILSRIFRDESIWSCSSVASLKKQTQNVPLYIISW